MASNGGRIALIGTGGGSSAVSPPLDGLVAWWAADQGISSDVDGVYSWANLVEGGPALVQATGAKKPDLTGDLNGKPVVQFDDTDDHMVATAALSAPATKRHVFMLARKVNPAAASNHYLCNFSSGGTYLVLWTNTAVYGNSNYIFTSNHADTTIGTVTAWKMIEFRNLNSGIIVKTFANLSNGHSGWDSDDHLRAATDVQLGSSGGACGFEFAEILVYDGVELSTDDRQAVYDYLRHSSRWGAF